MDDATFNARLQAIESAFRHLIAIRLDFERTGLWPVGEQEYQYSDISQFTDVISCKLTQLYFDKAHLYE